MTVSDQEFRDRLEGMEAFKKDGKFNKKQLSGSAEVEQHRAREV